MILFYVFYLRNETFRIQTSNMFLLIFITIILATVLYYIYGFNKVEPANGSNIPYASGWPIMWAFLRQLPHDEVEEVISKASRGNGIYLV